MVAQVWGLTWAFWRKGRLYLLSAPLVLAFLPSLIFAVFYLEGIWTAGESQPLELGSTLHLPFLLYGVPYVAFVILWFQGNPRQQYTLPASTWTLVGASMANGLLWTGGILALFVGITRAALGVAWPVWGPALLAATAYACAQAAVWGLNRSPSLQIVACATLVATLPHWMISRYGAKRWETHALWDTVTLPDAVMMAAIVGVAYVLAVAGVTLDRRGEGVHLGRIKRYLPWTSRGRLADRPAAQSPASAQLWCEWQRRGRLLPPCVAAIAIGMVAWSLSPWADLHDILPVFGQASIFLSFAGWLFGMFLGHRSNLSDIGSFEATRPLTDQQLAMAVVKNIAITVATCVVVWIGLLAIPMVVRFYLDGRGPALSLALESTQTMTAGDIVLAILFCCCLAWTPVALSATLVLGRRWLLHAVITGGPVVAMVGFFVWNWGLSRELQRLASQAALGTLGGVCVLAAPIGFWVGYRLGILDGRLTWRGLAAWVSCVAVGLVLTIGFSTLPLSFESLVLVLSLLTLPIAPFALAPLAVAWNRHR